MKGTPLDRREIDFAPSENTFGLKVFKEIRRTPENKEETYWMYGLPDTVQVFAMTVDNKVIAISEFQPGLGTTYVHCVGGSADQNETPSETAQRELLEETGYKTNNITLLSTILTDTGRSKRQLHLFLAKNCTRLWKPEKGVAVTLMDPEEFWRTMITYYATRPAEPHGGGNTLKLMTLAYHHLGLLEVTKGGDA